MDAERTPEIRIVVSGGAAMIATKIIERSTADIDVFAQRELEGDLIPGHPLPEWFVLLVDRVAARENLPRNWINATTSLVGGGLSLLPPRVLQQLDEREYGSRLKVGFLSRQAQILLKAHAIIGRDERRDASDFRALAPDESELAEALSWLRENELIDSAAVAEAGKKLKDALNESN